MFKGNKSTKFHLLRPLDIVLLPAFWSIPSSFCCNLFNPSFIKHATSAVEDDEPLCRERIVNFPYFTLDIQEEKYFFSFFSSPFPKILAHTLFYDFVSLNIKSRVKFFIMCNARTSFLIARCRKAKIFIVAKLKRKLLQR